MKETYNLVKPEDGIFMAYTKGLAAGIVVFVGCILAMILNIVVWSALGILALVVCAIILAACLVLFPLLTIVLPIVCIVYPYCVTITTDD